MECFFNIIGAVCLDDYEVFDCFFLFSCSPQGGSILQILLANL